MAIQSLQIEIGAALSGSFGATMSGSTNQLTKLGSTIKQLETQTKSVTQFQSMKQATLSAKQTWHDAEIQVKSLAQQMRQAGPGAKELSANFEKSKASAAKAKQAYLQNRDALQKMGTKLKQSGIDTKSLSSEQSKLGSSLGKLKTRYRSLDSIMQKHQAILSKRANLRGQMMDTVALAMMMAAPIKAARSFGDAMRGIPKVVKFDEKDGFEKLGNSIKKMSRTIPIAVEGLAKIATEGGQLGIKAKDLTKFTETVAKMSIAFNMTADETGTAVAKISKLFKVPVADMESLGDTINHVSSNMAASSKDIMTAMVKTEGATKLFGLTNKQSVALVSSMIAAGKGPEQAGMAISAILPKLQSSVVQTKKFQTALSKLGINAKEFRKNIKKDAEGALVGFFKAVSKVKKIDRAGVLDALFGRKNLKSAALMADSIGKYKKAITLASDETGQANSTQKEFERRTNSTGKNIQLLKNTLSEIGINIGNTLLPPLNGVINVIRKISSIFADFTAKYPLLTKVIMGTVTSLIAIKAAALGFGYIGTFISGGFNTILKVGKGLKNIFLDLGPILKTSFLTIGEYLLSFGRHLKSFFVSLGPILKTSFSAVGGALKSVGSMIAAHPILAAIAVIATGAFFVIKNWEKVKTFFSWLLAKIQPVLDKIGQCIKNIGSAISMPFKAIGKAWKWITGGQESPSEAMNEKADESRASAKSKESVKIIKEAASAPLRSTAPITSNKTQNNNYTITVNTQNSNNPKSVAEEVKKMLESKDDAYLYDSVAGAY